MSLNDVTTKNRATFQAMGLQGFLATSLLLIIGSARNLTPMHLSTHNVKSLKECGMVFHHEIIKGHQFLMSCIPATIFKVKAYKPQLY